jgi:hypothetical protein
VSSGAEIDLSGGAAQDLRADATDWYRGDAATRSAWLARVTREHPIDLPAVTAPVAPPPRAPFLASSRDDLDALISMLGEDDAARRRLGSARSCRGGSSARTMAKRASSSC